MTRFLYVLAATAAALAVWVVADPVAGVSFHPRHGSVTPATVVGTALGSCLCGWALLAILERRSVRARSVWTATASSVLIASLVDPLSAHAGTGGTVSLVCMHLAVAAVLIPGLLSTTRSRTVGSPRP